MIRRVLALCVFVFSAVAASATVATKTVSNSYGTITLSYNDSTNVVSWTYTFSRDATYYGAGWLYRHNNATDVYPAQSPVQSIFDTSAQSGNTASSGSFTPVTGAYYRIYIRAQYRSNNAIYIGQTTDYLRASPIDLPQTVSVTPSASILTAGTSILLTASGGHNSYSWSASGLGATLTYKDNKAIVQSSDSAKETDSFVVTVWSVAGSGYAESNHAECVINFKLKEDGSGDHYANLTFDNSARNYPVRFNVYQNGEVVYTLVVPGGQRLLKKVKLPSDAPYTITAVVKDPYIDSEGVWHEGVEKEVVVGSGTPDGGSQSGESPPDPEPETPDEPDIETDPVGFFQKKVQSYIDTAVSKSQEVAGKAEETGKFMTDHFTAPNHTVPSYSTDSGSISLGRQGNVANLSILKNPFDPTGPFGGVMHFMAALVKRIIAWSAVLGFVYFFFDRIYRVVADANQTTSIPSVISDGIANAGEGIGNIVSIPARVLLCVAVAVIVLAFPVILFTALKVGLPFSDIRSTFTAGVAPSTMVSAGGSVLQKAWALAGEVVPWDVLLAVPLWGFVVRVVIIPKLFFWQFFYKFLPT